MFSSLHALARAATLHLLIVAEGERLRVTLQPRPTGADATVPPPLQLVATPAEFDVGFVEAVRTYQAPAASLIEQASGAAQAVAEAAEKQKTAAAKTPAKPAKKPAAKKHAPAKAPEHIAAAQKAHAEQRAAAADSANDAATAAADPASDEPSAEERADNADSALQRIAAGLNADAKKARVDRKAQREAEAAKARADKQAAAAERKRERDAAREAAAAERRALAQAKRDQAAARRAEKGPGRNASPADIEADRAACIADARGYLALIGDVKPSRSAFLATMPPTGRRYERLFVSWNEFMDAARQQDLPIEENGATQPAAIAEPSAASAAEATATSTDTPPPADVAVPADHAWNLDALALQTASQTGEPVTLANMEAPPPQATDGLFSGEPQLEGDAAPVAAPAPAPVAPIALDLI